MIAAAASLALTGVAVAADPSTDEPAVVEPDTWESTYDHTLVGRWNRETLASADDGLTALAWLGQNKLQVAARPVGAGWTEPVVLLRRELSGIDFTLVEGSDRVHVVVIFQPRDPFDTRLVAQVWTVNGDGTVEQVTRARWPGDYIGFGDTYAAETDDGGISVANLRGLDPLLLRHWSEEAGWSTIDVPRWPRWLGWPSDLQSVMFDDADTVTAIIHNQSTGRLRSITSTEDGWDTTRLTKRAVAGLGELDVAVGDHGEGAVGWSWNNRISVATRVDGAWSTRTVEKRITCYERHRQCFRVGFADATGETVVVHHRPVPRTTYSDIVFRRLSPDGTWSDARTLLRRLREEVILEPQGDRLAVSADGAAVVSWMVGERRKLFRCPAGSSCVALPASALPRSVEEGQYTTALDGRVVTAWLTDDFDPGVVRSQTWTPSR